MAIQIFVPVMRGKADAVEELKQTAESKMF